MSIRAPRSRLTTAAALIAAGTFTVAVNLAAGLEPAAPGVIPDSAFRPVELPSAAPGALQAPGALEAPVPSLDIPVIAEPLVRTPAAERAQPSLEAARPIVVPIATPRPTPKPAPKTTRSISGAASWYCRAGISPCTVNHPDDGGFDAYAAAGPKLRAAIGSSWRGTIIYVDGIRVKIIDWCQCYKGEPHEKIIDLYYDVFARTGSSVTIRW